jgi:hypothetical protein
MAKKTQIDQPLVCKCGCGAVLMRTVGRGRHPEYVPEHRPFEQRGTEYAKTYRHRRKAQGRPVWKDVPKERRRRYVQKHLSNPEARERLNALMRSYAARPDIALKRRARRAVRTAVSQGLLLKLPCAQCESLKSEAHHADYSRPLDVVWLCRHHHVEADLALKYPRQVEACS